MNTYTNSEYPGLGAVFLLIYQEFIQDTNNAKTRYELRDRLMGAIARCIGELIPPIPYYVVCDETNNPPDAVKANDLRALVMIERQDGSYSHWEIDNKWFGL